MKWMHLGLPRGNQSDVLIVDGKQVACVYQQIGYWRWSVNGRGGRAESQNAAKQAAEARYTETALQ